jgi:hypothetical protein
LSQCGPGLVLDVDLLFVPKLLLLPHRDDRRLPALTRGILPGTWPCLQTALLAWQLSGAHPGSTLVSCRRVFSLARFCPPRPPTGISLDLLGVLLPRSRSPSWICSFSLQATSRSTSRTILVMSRPSTRSRTRTLRALRGAQGWRRGPHGLRIFGRGLRRCCFRARRLRRSAWALAQAFPVEAMLSL